MAKFLKLEQGDGNPVFINMCLVEKFFWDDKNELTCLFLCSRCDFGFTTLSLVKESPEEIMRMLEECANE